LAKGTVRRRIGRAKQFFKAAIKHEIIDRNPFSDEESAAVANPDRMFLVPADWIEACIRKAPCEDWRIILALARYAGMRSHECRIQRWDDIDLPNNRMISAATKPRLFAAARYSPNYGSTCCGQRKWHQMGLSSCSTVMTTTTTS
jgi:integrase